MSKAVFLITALEMIAVCGAFSLIVSGMLRLLWALL
jgi:hypothetical protein